ncbi:MAG: YegS/Rv2252/BmrU family lipid kinase [Oscillospiraceae bacterium]|nr:YegS/Rv2252/BmrU family lipid kinase [Oscillospiraceae bacterium]
MKKVYFIYNPYSGKGTIQSKITKIVSMLTEHDYEVTIRPTQCQMDACETVKRICSELPLYDLVLCSGGDGTLNEVIQGLMTSENRIPVGYIPSGTTNDFARSINTPKGYENALLSIIHGSSISLDIGSFNSKYFTYIAAFGAFTEVAYETRQQTKNMLGHVAYILEGMRHLNKIQSYSLTISHDGETTSGEYVFGMITNTAYVGGLLSMGEDFSLNDGLYEVTLIKTPNSPLELQSVLSSLINIKQAINTEYVTFFKTSDIKITSDDDLTWTLDGENGGKVNSVHIYNNHKALRFITPPARIIEIEE